MKSSSGPSLLCVTAAWVMLALLTLCGTILPFSLVAVAARVDGYEYDLDNQEEEEEQYEHKQQV